MKIATQCLSRLFLSTLAIGALAACQPDDPNRAGVSGKTVVSTGTAAIGGPFTLIDTTGATVTDATLTGKPHLIYFGFAYCPDVCPTALSKLGAAQTLLGERGDEVGYVLITVDPERDTAEKLGTYITADPFPRGLRGFTGTPEQIDAAKAVYRVASSKVMPDGSPVPNGADDYTVDHSDIIYLMGPDGQFVDFFSARSTPQDIAIRVRQLLANKK